MRFSYVILLTLITLFLNNSVFADNKLYLKVTAGATVPGYEHSIDINGRNIKKTNTNTLLNTQIALGYYFTDALRADISFGTFFGNRSSNTSLSVSDQTYQFSTKSKANGSIMLNAYLDLFDFGDNAKFYLGGGVGVGFLTQKNSTTSTTTSSFITSGSTTINGVTTSNSSSNTTNATSTLHRNKNIRNFAYQVTAGVTMPLTTNLVADFAYSFESLGSTKSFKHFGLEFGKEKYLNNNFLISLRYNI